MRRRRGNPVIVLLLVLGLLVLLIYTFSSILVSSQGKAKRVVNEFYRYEQDSDFGRSWELLHPIMQDRFGRGSYVQDRAHVFNGHFGADTFSYEVSGAKELKGWKMEKEGEVFASVFQFTVEQTYHGKYGHFVFQQYVYVVKEGKEWRILWDYKK